MFVRDTVADMRFFSPTDPLNKAEKRNHFSYQASELLPLLLLFSFLYRNARPGASPSGTVAAFQFVCILIRVLR